MRLFGWVFTLIFGANAHSAAPPRGNDSQPASVPAPLADHSQATPVSVVDLRLQALEEVHRTATVAALRDSTHPRDWMLAALILKFNRNETIRRQAEALIARAATAAPDDALVQWLVLMQSNAAPHDDVAASTALSNLIRLEPENAVVWIPVMSAAAQKQDEAAVDVALNKMGQSKRADEHLFDLLGALVEVFKKYPLPDEYFVLSTAGKSSDNALQPIRQTLAYVQADDIALAAALPAYQWLVRVCRLKTHNAGNAARAQYCATGGRLLAEHGNLQITNRIGYAMLRVSGTYTRRDVESARQQDWLQRRSRELDQTNATDLIERIDDQILTGNELAASRRLLLRAAQPVTPPPDWIDDSSPFSAERLRADETATRENRLK
jgi:hypothetical protein